MKKIKFIKSRKDAQWSFLLNDGRLIEILGFEGFSIKYDTPFSLETDEIIGRSPEWPRFGASLPDYVPDGYTTLNNLTAQGLGDTVYCYEQYDINMGRPDSLSKKQVKVICDEFNANGFNVTPEAVLHNFSCWLGDLKSGYRDEKNGYHLFSPCGCNDLSFRATTLDDRLDWQTTYFC